MRNIRRMDFSTAEQLLGPLLDALGLTEGRYVVMVDVLIAAGVVLGGLALVPAVCAALFTVALFVGDRDEVQLARLRRSALLCAFFGLFGGLGGSWLIWMGGGM